MDTYTNYDGSFTPICFDYGGPESVSNRSSISRMTSAAGDIIRELESTGEIVTKFELDVACVYEKVVNLNLLLMQVETKESDFDAFVSHIDTNLSELGVKALEFDLLSGILESELRVIESQIYTLQMDFVNRRELLSTRKHLGEALLGMEDALCNSETSLEQSLEQVSDMKVQSSSFQRKLSRFRGDETWKDMDHTECSDDGDHTNLKEKVKMQTVENQRHILRMLEKSLEKELDYEKRVIESIEIEEALTMRLQALEQVVLYAEEEAELNLEKLYEADNKCELLTGAFKELSSQIQMLQFNLKGSVQQEAELSSKLQETVETLKAKESALLKLEKGNAELELQLANAKASNDGVVELENTIKDLKEKLFEAERTAENVEAKNQLLTESSNELKSASERVVLLEKELSDTKVKLQNAEASVEASHEKQSMLYSTIEDMENVIEDMKKKVSKAEIQTESVEDKCIFLSESNADLTEELNRVRGKMERLEVSLQHTEETKKATAKDIRLRTKLITDLVMQMALERERLQKQISSLKQENKILEKCLKQMDKGPAIKVSRGDKAHSTDHRLSEFEITTVAGTTEKTEVLTNNEPDEILEEAVRSAADSASESYIARNIDARELKLKYVFLFLLGLMVPLFAVLLHQSQVREV